MDTKSPSVVLLVPFVAVLAAAFSLPGTIATDNPPEDDKELVLFSYFKGNGESGVYLQASENGLNFTEVNDGNPVFTPPDSAWPEDQRLTRDPSILYRDGTFHMVWTTNWEGRIFGYARSPDLKQWSTPQKVRPFPEDLSDQKQPENVWAPEIHYDPIEEDYFVVFSSTIPERLDDGAEGEDMHGNNHRMYVTRTEDFETFSDAEVFFNPGFSSIDGQLVYDEYGSPEAKDDRWIMVYKHERGPERGGKNLRIVYRDPLTGAFSNYSEPIVGPGSNLNEHWAEGPTLLKTSEDTWNLYWDAYRAGYYGLAQSSDLKQWEDATGKLNIGVSHPRHGSFFRAPAAAVGWTGAE